VNTLTQASFPNLAQPRNLGRSTYNEVVTRFRLWAAVTTLAAALGAAIWLYTYRVRDAVISSGYIIDAGGRPFHPTELVSVQPWWSVYAAVAVALVGGIASLLILPEARDWSRALRRRTQGRARAHRRPSLRRHS
jgi:cytosine/uracil/thiamine/allantoin permease